MRPSARVLSPSVPGTAANALWIGRRSPPVRTVTIASASSSTSPSSSWSDRLTPLNSFASSDHRLPRRARGRERHEAVAADQDLPDRRRSGGYRRLSRRCRRRGRWCRRCRGHGNRAGSGSGAGLWVPRRGEQLRLLRDEDRRLVLRERRDVAQRPRRKHFDIPGHRIWRAQVYQAASSAGGDRGTEGRDQDDPQGCGTAAACAARLGLQDHFNELRALDPNANAPRSTSRPSPSGQVTLRSHQRYSQSVNPKFLPGRVGDDAAKPVP